MAQPPWHAAPKLPPGQGPLLLDNQLKNITHLVVLSSPANTGIPLKRAVRRHLPYRRANDQNMKQDLKEGHSVPKRNAPCEITEGGTERLAAGDNDGQKCVDSDELKSAARNKRFVVRIPSEGKIEASTSLKPAPLVPSEAFEGLESTTMRDCTSTGTSDSGLVFQGPLGSEVGQLCTIEVLQALDPPELQSRPTLPEMDSLQDIPQPTEPTKPSPKNLSTDTVEAGAEVSPTPSITVPRAAPSTPITIPKREIKLVTASSRAAEWFTRGFVVSASKNSQPPPKKIETSPKDYVPPADVGQIETYMEAPCRESIHTESSGVLWESNTPKTADVDCPTSSVLAKNEENVKLEAVPDVIVTSDNKISENTQVGPLPVLEMDSESDVEKVEVISEQKISFSIKRIVRPYYLGPPARDNNVNSPSATDVQIPCPIILQSFVSSDAAESTVHETCSGEVTSDPSAGCPIHIPGPDDDGAKMRWFREEIHRRAERDDSWTVTGSQRRTPQLVAVSGNVESNTSPVAVEPVMTESSNISSSTTEAPVVIPFDLNKDAIIAESVQVTASPPSNADTSTTVQASNEVPRRYIVRGGQVRRSQASEESCPPVPEPRSADNALNEVGSLPAKNENDALGHQESLVIPESLLQRKPNKVQIATKFAPGDSDGWSTDSESESKATSLAEQMEGNVAEGSAASTAGVTERDVSEAIDEDVQTEKTMEKTHRPDSRPLEQAMQSTTDMFDHTKGALRISVPQETVPDMDYPSNTLTEESLRPSHPPIEKDVPKYQIIAGQVRKVSCNRSRPGTPSTMTSMPPTPSDSSTTQTTFTRPPLEKAHPPQGIKKFVHCGDMAVDEMADSLACGGSPTIHGPINMFCGPQVRKRHLEDSSRVSSQFRCGKTNPINQPSVREEKFDPFSEESEANLKRLRDEFVPILELHPPVAIASFLSKSPHCFCLKPCARFDGIVPVYVCGSFKSLPPNSRVTKGCTFHMHVSFWDHLHDTFECHGRDKEKAFSDESLVPHLNACPYLNFTFCVKFSMQNAFPMYLPAELRATNLCACDLDLHLDFSELLQHWVFSCPHFHQPGAPKKCVTRLLVMVAKYRLIDISPNLHGGGAIRANAQTVVLDDKVPAGQTKVPHVHLPSVDGTSQPRPQRDDDEGEVLTRLFSSFTANAAGSKEWLGDNPSKEALAEYDNKKKEIVEMTGKLLTQYLESYLSLEKLYDLALCQKIKDDEQRKREDARMRLKSNNISCMGCTEQNPMAIFVPCYHMVMCEKCSGKVKVCPTCRRDITESHRVYIA